jgi:hypothetical protein
MHVPALVYILPILAAIRLDDCASILCNRDDCCISSAAADTHAGAGASEVSEHTSLFACVRMRARNRLHSSTHAGAGTNPHLTLRGRRRAHTSLFACGRKTRSSRPAARRPRAAAAAPPPSSSAASRPPRPPEPPPGRCRHPRRCRRRPGCTRGAGRPWRRAWRGRTAGPTCFRRRGPW